MERLAEQFRWYAPEWTPENNHVICSDQDFSDFVTALGKAAMDDDFLNLLYFLAQSAQTEAERANRAYCIFDRMRYYEPGTEAEQADFHRRQLENPPAARKADALDTIRFLAPPEEPPAEDGSILSISARELQDKEFQPIQWVVEGLLPQGLALVASPPKFGKSWLVLDLCLSVSAGQRFLDMPTHKCDCLYLALEDSQRRLQDRMNKVLQGERAPDGFAFATTARDLGSGLLEQLGAYADTHPACGLMVIDTLQKVRRTTGRSANAYESDYKDIGELQKFAIERNLCVVLVHHLRKMKDETDPFARISGTNGILGAADSALVMTRERRSDDTTTLAITGRDLESCELALRFDKTLFRWQSLGDANARAREQARREYENSALVQTIRKLVDRGHGQWSGSAQEILEAGKILTRRFIADNAKELGVRLRKLQPELLEFDGIMYEKVKRGATGGAKHLFYRNAAQDRVVQENCKAA